jgi:hypothetical protein
MSQWILRARASAPEIWPGQGMISRADRIPFALFFCGKFGPGSGVRAIPKVRHSRVLARLVERRVSPVLAVPAHRLSGALAQKTTRTRGARGPDGRACPSLAVPTRLSPLSVVSLTGRLRPALLEKWPGEWAWFLDGCLLENHGREEPADSLRISRRPVSLARPRTEDFRMPRKTAVSSGSFAMAGGAPQSPPLRLPA